MKINKRLGIYLNYQHAHLIEFSSNALDIKTIESDFTHEVKEETIQKGEKAMHHKEQREQLAYFKKICEIIKHYNEVILFGPTKAKDELHNLLTADTHYSKIDVQVAKTDDITLKQQQDFVMQYFSKKLSKPML